jgi:hypothetical protein
MLFRLEDDDSGVLGLPGLDMDRDWGVDPLTRPTRCDSRCHGRMRPLCRLAPSGGSRQRSACPHNGPANHAPRAPSPPQPAQTRFTVTKAASARLRMPQPVITSSQSLPAARRMEWKRPLMTHTACLWCNKLDVAKVRTGSMLLKNSRNLIFDSGSIPNAVVAQAAPYDLKMPRAS